MAFSNDWTSGLLNWPYFRTSELLNFSNPRSSQIIEPPWGFRHHSEGMRWAKRTSSPRIVDGVLINRYPLGGCGNAMYLSCHMLPKCVVFVIAATPKGVASYLYPALFSRGIASFAVAHSLIPSLCSRNPQGGSVKWQDFWTSQILGLFIWPYFWTSVLLNFSNPLLPSSGLSPNLRLPFGEPPSSFRRISVFLSPIFRKWLFTIPCDYW